MILGVAGGNGLEHILPGQFGRIYAVDINEDYLFATARRFPGLDRLTCVRADLADPSVGLPHADLLIADLLIEYIGIPVFCRVVRKICPLYVSCVIRKDAPERGWVSDSPYLHVFDGLEGIHTEVPGSDLTEALRGIGCAAVLTEAADLPNGKKLIRLDHSRTAQAELTGTSKQVSGQGSSVSVKCHHSS